MSTLLKAMQTKNSRTENGMVTNTTSLNACVDFFFTAGAMRKADEGRIAASFSQAFNEDALTAMKLLFWARDVRGGAGERRLAKVIYKYLAENHADTLIKNMYLLPEYGRWDDVLDLVESSNSSVRTSALNLIKLGLENKDGLCAKWMPRPTGNNKVLANIIRKHLGLDPKSYRKLLTGLTQVIETAMCAKDYSKVNYSHVPSLAMARYTKAFSKNDLVRFNEYKDKLVKGEVKINASAVYPYDVVKTSLKGDKQVANEQWKVLPNYMEGTDENIICMVDTSGSMFWDESKVAGDLYAGHVAQSLAIYVSERNGGAFKDAFLTFNSSPELQVLNGNLSDKLLQLSRAHVGGGTDIEACFKYMLNFAVKGNVPSKDMPSTIVILSDMEFNRCSSDPDATAYEMIKQEYETAGYKLPKVVFWNLASRNKNVPVQFTQMGTALISGFSPSIMTAILKSEEFTPYSIMMSKINEERYSKIKI